MSAKPTCPESIDGAGRVLWDRLVGIYDFDEHELALLEVVAHQADDVGRLEALIAKQGVVVAGSNGQPRLSAAVAEVRQGRLALGKLLGLLALPDEVDKPMTASSRAAKHAADVRWSRVRHQRERLAGGAA